LGCFPGFSSSEELEEVLDELMLLNVNILFLIFGLSVKDGV
jgi:hypothetical protein